MTKNIIVVVVAFLGLAFSHAKGQSDMDKAREFLKNRNFRAAAPFVVSAATQNRKDLNLQLLAGDVLTEIDKLDSALIFYRKAEDIENDDPVVVRKLGLGLSRVGRHSEAVAALNEMIDDLGKDDADINLYLALGQVYLAADSTKRAELIVRKARRLDKENPETYVALGDLYYAKNVFQLAKSNYEEALKRDTTLLEPRIKLARAYNKLARTAGDREQSNALFTKCLLQWDQVTQMDPLNERAHFEKGKILFLAKRYTSAATALHDYLKLNPEGDQGRWYLAQSYYNSKRIDSAITQLEIVRERMADKKEEAASLLARAYFLARNFDKSLPLYAELKAADKLDAADLERYGRAAVIAGDTTTAIENFEAAITADPSKCRLNFMFAILLQDRGDYDYAITMFRQYLQNCQDSLAPRIWYFIGSSHFSAGRVDSAIAALNQCIALDSMDINAKILLSTAYQGNENFDQARVTLQSSLTAMAGDTVKYRKEINRVYLALCTLEFQNDSNSFSVVNKISKDWVKIDPESANSHLFLGVSYQGLGDKDKACREYREVLKIDKDNETAKNYLSTLGC